MFIGHQSRPKVDIIVYLIIMLLVEGSVDSNEIKNKFNITTKTFYRYMSYIKNMLFDYEIYYIDIEYDRKTKLHKCVVNSSFKSEKKIVLVCPKIPL